MNIFSCFIFYDFFAIFMEDFLNFSLYIFSVFFLNFLSLYFFPYFSHFSHFSVFSHDFLDCCTCEIYTFWPNFVKIFERLYSVQKLTSHNFRFILTTCRQMTMDKICQIITSKVMGSEMPTIPLKCI